MNPFRYGSVVSGTHFYDRKEEVRSLCNDVESGNNLVLYAPRRYGKTSLIFKVMDELRGKGINTVYVDFFNVEDKRSFLEYYSDKLLKAKKAPLENLIKKFRKFVKGIEPSVSFDESGKPVFKFSFNFNVTTPDATFDEVINLPERWANGERWLVVFDEFQEIVNLNGNNFEKQLRANIQHHKNVSYVFMGSKTHLLLNIFNNKSRSLYNSGKLFKIDKIPEQDTFDFLKRKFNGTNISENTIRYIITNADNIPYYVQFIASQVWQTAVGKKSIMKSDIDTALKRTMDAQSDFYEEVYGKLSILQKKILRALIYENEFIYSTEYLLKHNLGPSSSVQKGITKLIEEGIIERTKERYEYSDPIFKRFLKLRLEA